MSRIIHLTRGYATVVDDADYEWLTQWKWCVCINNRGKPYAQRIIHRKSEHGVKRMSRVILDAPADLQVDHINGDSLDNRRANLRLCTLQENCQNRGANRKGTSRFVGVSREPYGYRSVLGHNKVRYYLGIFSSEEEAARAHDTAALRLCGQFARLNFPTEEEL
jgi:predicted metallo-beta-lactamase superfamily hydrolase